MNPWKCDFCDSVGDHGKYDGEYYVCEDCLCEVCGEIGKDYDGKHCSIRCYNEGLSEYLEEC